MRSAAGQSGKGDAASGGASLWEFIEGRWPDSSVARAGGPVRQRYGKQYFWEE